ncbi:MAG: tRNA lysidine(34) synthetase TilS [Prevotellaceae bacterium]|nr:tRNA lysidine(34) synthetase TilS [Prevotellaceae bacterium]
MLNKIKKYIATNNLLCKEELHIVALSGGADSVCLLRVMLMLGYKVHAAHCNFKLRGEESERDEQFCKDLCKKLGVELHLTHFDTLTYSILHKISVEMAARNLRYSYFEQLRKAIGASSIIVAHHRDDNVETILLNLIRGTGIHGLEGIKPKNGYIIRPLLSASKEEIVAFLTQHKQAYITDSSNLKDDVQRNNLRLNVIPLLESINPAVKANISRTAQNIAETVKIVDNAVNTSIKQCVTTHDNGIAININNLQLNPSPKQVFFSILTQYGFTPQQVSVIFANIHAPSGKTWHSATHILASDRGNLLIEAIEHNRQLPSLRIPEAGTYIYNNGQACIGVNVIKRQDDFKPSRKQYEVTLDASKVAFPITIRPIRKGDRFSPFGMKGKKLLSDYLTDCKRNYFQRCRQLVVEDSNGVIVWVVGLRTSQYASCTDNTINVLTLRYIEENNNHNF